MPAASPPTDLTDTLDYRSLAEAPTPLDGAPTPDALSRTREALEAPRQHPDHADLLEPLASEIKAVRTLLEERAQAAEALVQSDARFGKFAEAAQTLAEESLALEQKRREAAENGTLTPERRQEFRRQRLDLLKTTREKQDATIRELLDRFTATKPIPNPPENKAAQVSLALAKATDMSPPDLARRALSAAAGNDMTSRALADGFLLKMERRIEDATEKIEDPDISLTDRQEAKLREERDLLGLTVDLVQASQETEHTLAHELAAERIREYGQAVGAVVRGVAEEGSWHGSHRARLAPPEVLTTLGLSFKPDPFAPDPTPEETRLRKIAAEAEQEEIKRERAALARRLGTTPEALNNLLDDMEAEADG